MSLILTWLLQALALMVVAYILPGEVGGQANPSEIKDARTGAIIRPS